MSAETRCTLSHGWLTPESVRQMHTTCQAFILDDRAEGINLRPQAPDFLLIHAISGPAFPALRRSELFRDAKTRDGLLHRLDRGFHERGHREAAFHGRMNRGFHRAVGGGFDLQLLFALFELVQLGVDRTRDLVGREDAAWWEGHSPAFAFFTSVSTFFLWAKLQMSVPRAMAP